MGRMLSNTKKTIKKRNLIKAPRAWKILFLPLTSLTDASRVFMIEVFPNAKTAFFKAILMFVPLSNRSNINISFVLVAKQVSCSRCVYRYAASAYATT